MCTEGVHGIVKDMSYSEHGDIPDEAMLEKGKNIIEDVKEERDDFAICEPMEEEEVTESSKRTSAEIASDINQPMSKKRVRVAGEVCEQWTEKSIHLEPLCLNTTGEKRDCIQEKSRASYRKPLFSISHRITEKRITPSLEQQASQAGGQRVNYSTVLSPQLLGLGENGRSASFPTAEETGQSSSTDSGLYPLVEKMFFILNTLNSSMTQLHSKVDLLSLEVMRIKKQLKPAEMLTEFQPPPEYLLTSDELHQLMEQASNAGELGCRLLVHLFPELFKAKECTLGCMASKRTLDSLHLQLIRNYVEVCFPLVKNNGVWQEECLIQINDFFNRFWAQRDMEGARLHRKQTGNRQITGATIKVEHTQPCPFITDEHQEEDASVDGQQSMLVTPDPELDEFSSPEDFVVFLVHRLFPEVFEDGKIPEGSGSFHSVGQVILDSNRIDIIKKYMEANFPDVPEKIWLQLCIQHIEDALEGPHSNGSEHDHINDESYDLSTLPEDGSIIKVPDLGDYERPSRRSKKSLLAPVDFDNLEIPPPDFSVPQEYILSKQQLKKNYDCSLSIGNFASRLLVLMFPELFTNENARKHYNCSGSLGKKQLDPIRVNLIRHYVQMLYPQAKNDRVWTLEFVGKLDERCRRRDTEQRRSYQQQQQRRVYVLEGEQETGDLVCSMTQVSPDGLQDEADVPSLPPEKSSKDFCKIPLDELTISAPDFQVALAYILSDTEVREIVQQSLSVGNFAARLLVRLFPELFTQENLRLQYNHSGACNKKQLDPVRLRLIRHYVEAVYPVDKMEEVWHYECVPSIDERCRRPNRKKCDILKKAKRSNTDS